MPGAGGCAGLSDVLLGAGWADVGLPAEALYDLWLDPAEGNNRIDDPALKSVLEDLKHRLEEWMARTHDPLLGGPVAPPTGTVHNTPDQTSPSDPVS